MAAVLEIPDETGESSVWRGFAWSLTRDLKLAIRSKAELGVQLLFYVIVVTLFPLAVGAEPLLLRTLGPGVLWVAALLASLLVARRMPGMAIVVVGALVLGWGELANVWTGTENGPAARSTVFAAGWSLIAVVLAHSRWQIGRAHV